MARSGFDRQVIERYVRPHLLALSVAGPSVISPAFSPPGRPFQCPTALTRLGDNGEFTAPGDRTVTDDATCKTAQAREHSMFQRLFMQLLCDFCRSFWVGDYARFSVLGCQG